MGGNHEWYSIWSFSKCSHISGDGHRVLGVIYKDGFSAPAPVVEEAVEEAPAEKEIKKVIKKVVKKVVKKPAEEKPAEVIEEEESE
jgi:hypothetical protein